MTTKELIDAALAAVTAKTQTAATLAQATTSDNNAANSLASANRSVHDDLAANGQALYISTDVPPIYSVATAVDPNTFALTPIRLA